MVAVTEMPPEMPAETAVKSSKTIMALDQDRHVLFDDVRSRDCDWYLLGDRHWVRFRYWVRYLDWVGYFDRHVVRDWYSLFDRVRDWFINRDWVRFGDMNWVWFIDRDGNFDGNRYRDLLFDRNWVRVRYCDLNLEITRLIFWRRKCR